MLNGFTEGGGRETAKTTLEPNSLPEGPGSQGPGLTLRPLVWAGPHPVLATLLRIRTFSSRDSAGMWGGGKLKRPLPQEPDEG